VASVQDDAGSGRSLAVTWGTNGRIATLTDSAGRTVSYGYDTNGTLTSVTNPKGHVTTLTYTAGRWGPLLTSMRDNWNRLITQLEWLSDDRLLSYTDGEYTGVGSKGEKYTYNYLSAGVLNKTDSFSSTTQLTDANSWLRSPNGSYGNAFDSAGRLTQSHEGTYDVYYWYDASGRLDKMQKGGVYWKYTYDSNYPDQATSLVAYNDFQTQSPNRDFAATYVTYVPPGQSGAGQPQDVTQLRSDGVTLDTLLHYGYDSKGELTTATDVNGITSTFAYNAAGDLVTVARPEGTTQYGYDSLGRVTTVTNALGKTTTYAYDELDRVTSITLPKPTPSSPLTFATSVTYDAYDAATGLTFIAVTDPNSHVTKSGFDALDHLVQQVDALNNVTTYSYKYNLLDSITDANGNVTQFGYDGNRVRNKTTRPDGSTDTYQMSADGILFSKTDGRGVNIGYSYDVWGRVTSFSASKNGQTLESITNTYVGQKLMTAAYTRGGATDTITYTYDTAYRLLTETQGTRAKITYSYPLTGASTRLSGYSIAAADGTGPTTGASYAYDTAGRIANVSWVPLNQTYTTFGFTYNALGQFATMSFPDGEQRTYTYDDQNRLTQLTHTHPVAGLLAQFSYAYDHDWATNTDTAKGMLTSVTVNSHSQLGQQNGLTKYTYDARYMLTRVDYPYAIEQFAYDSIGNRLSEQGSFAYRTYSYYLNGSGQNTPRLRNDGQMASDFSYDGVGNLLGTVAAPTAQWDAQNRLLSMSSSYTQTYDFGGRRVTGKAGTSTTSYVYNGLHVVSERKTSPASQTDYVFAPGFDHPLAFATGQNSPTYFVTDGLGSVIGSAQGDGTVGNGTFYRAFGAFGSTAVLFGYTGRESSGTGYLNFRARYYDPYHGRFISEDPIQDMFPVVGGDLYSYAANSPAMNVDPMGLSPCKWTITHGIGVKTGEEWNQEWRQFRAVLSQVPTRTPPGTKGMLGGKWPVWVKMIMTCDWNRYLTVTTHWTRKIHVRLECDCPQSATEWDDQQEWSDSHEYFQGGAETTSSWLMGAPMKPCAHP